MKQLIGTQKGFDIYFEALPEDLPLEDTFDDSVTNIKKLYKDIESGKLVYFLAKVTAERAGIELGADYVGACCYESTEQFIEEYDGGYIADMVYQAINEAEDTIDSINGLNG